MSSYTVTPADGGWNVGKDQETICFCTSEVRARQIARCLEEDDVVNGLLDSLRVGWR